MFMIFGDGKQIGLQIVDAFIYSYYILKGCFKRDVCLYYFLVDQWMGKQHKNFKNQDRNNKGKDVNKSNNNQKSRDSSR